MQLAVNHPGFSDPEYRRRRAIIAAQGAEWRQGEPIPRVAYTDAEHDVWALVSSELAAQHEANAAAEFLEASERLALPADHIPQLGDLSDRLSGLSGFTVEPVAGLVPARYFYGKLAHQVFCSTQYVRHTSVPLYTPEPDVIHEVVGHLNLLASPVFARLHQLAGGASQRAADEEAHEFFSKVFWFSLEFGVVWEGGDLKAYGAGLLSSFGELQAFRDAEIRPFDIQAMGTTEYDITKYQPVLFAAESIDHVSEELGGFFAGYHAAAA